MKHILWCIKVYISLNEGGGCTGGINTDPIQNLGGGGGGPESPCKVWEDKSEYIYAYPSEAPGSSQSSCLISWLISNVSLLLFNWIYA